MAEIRQNPITKDWVIIASERTKRPDDFKELSSESHLCEYRPDCPFCPGNGKLTSEAILVFSDNMVQGCQCEWGIPTLILFKGGKAVNQVVGAVPKIRLKAMIGESLK